MTTPGWTGERLFPFYVACDVSQSMWLPEFQPPNQRALPFDVLRAAIPRLINDMEANPTVSDAAMLSIVAFADEPRVYLPLMRPREVRDTARLEQGYRTDYAAVFDCLHARIWHDCERLGAWYRVKEPAVFFLTDGEPYVEGGLQDERVWTAALDRLLAPAFPWRPQIVAFGLGTVRERTLCRIATRHGDSRLAFVADESRDAGDLVDAIMRTAFASIGDTVTRGSLVVHPPPGMRLACCPE